MSGTAANIKALTEKVRDLVSRWISSWPTQFRLMLLSAQ